MQRGRMLLLTGLATVLIFGLGNAQAGGSLTPPGAPGPTMRTLDEVARQAESRTLISSLPYTISQAGSYCLATNLSGSAGITISAAANVTIDMNGFTLSASGATAGRWGIDGAAAGNVVVRNGRIRGWTGGGMRLGSVAYLEGLNVENCTGGNGIEVSQQSHVLRCRVGACSAGSGIYVGGFTIVDECVSVANGTNGITAAIGSQILHCVSTHNKSDGIRVTERCIVVDNIANFNGNAGDGAGIHITGTQNRIENNQMTASDRGLDIDAADNYVAGNTVRGNTDNYDLVAGNQLNLLLCEVPETIDWPATVKFAGTLTCAQTGVNGITVNANDVTIDLDGHALVGPGASSKSGIYQAAACRNLRVSNGSVRRWLGSAQGGIYALGKGAELRSLQLCTNYFGLTTALGGPSDAIITDCIASENSVGIHAGAGSIVSRCTAHRNLGTGIAGLEGARISESTAYANKGPGIDTARGATISSCTAYSNTVDGIKGGDGSRLSQCTAYGNQGNGIVGANSTVISDCVATGNGLAGIHTDWYTVMRNCTALENTGNGIEAQSDCTFTGCTADNNAGDGIRFTYRCSVVNCTFTGQDMDGKAGIHATGDNNTIDSNVTYRNFRGIWVEGWDNLVTRNRSSAEVYPFIVTSLAGNRLGVIISPPTSASSADGRSGGAGLGTTDPWANFRY